MPGHLRLSNDTDGTFLPIGNNECFGQMYSADATLEAYKTKKVAKAASLPYIAIQANEWARTILGSDLSVATPEAFILLLRNQAPVYVVRFLLAINPKVISIPKSGPTPLQVAVQNGAPLDVIRVLLEACPFGLCITNPDHSEDPLSYAKRHHKDRPGLIELLSRPLTYWIIEGKQRQQQERNQNLSFIAPPVDTNAAIKLSSKKLYSSVFVASTVQNSFVGDSYGVDIQSRVSNVNKTENEEIQNIKVLCLHLLKAHKKMAKQIVAYRDEIQLHAKTVVANGKESIIKTNLCDKDEILHELHEQQRKLFCRHLIALDMNEKAFEARVRKIEQSCLSNMDAKMNGWRKSTISWRESTHQKLNELQILMDNEIKINARFRSDLAEWMEEQQHRESRHAPSFLYATNLGELNEAAPLWDRATKTMDQMSRRGRGDNHYSTTWIASCLYKMTRRNGNEHVDFTSLQLMDSEKN